MTNTSDALNKVDRANRFIRFSAIALLVIIASMVGYALYQQSQFIQRQQTESTERSKVNKELLEQQLKLLECLAKTNIATRTVADVEACVKGVAVSKSDSSATDNTTAYSQPAPSNIVTVEPKPTPSANNYTPPQSDSSKSTSNQTTPLPSQSQPGQVDLSDTVCSLQGLFLTKCIIDL